MIPIGTSQNERTGLTMRLVNNTASSIEATLEQSDYEGVLNSYFEMFDSVHFVANVNLSFHQE